MTRSKPCVICGKPDYCTRAENVVRCMRVETGSFRECLERGGWFHRTGPASFPPHLPDGQMPPPPALPERSDQMAATMLRLVDQLNHHDLVRHAITLGVSSATLRRDMHAGQALVGDALAFPMQRAGVGIVGIRYRSIDGKKWAEPQSRNGLFLPRAIGKKPGCMIVEGPTDTGALTELGIEAFGKPQAQGHRQLIAECIRHHGWESVVIWRDDDPPQRNGEPGDGPRHSAKLAIYLHAAVCEGELPKLKRITVAQPPDGFKDVRAWKNAGAERDDIIEHVRKTRDEHTPEEILNGKRISHRCADLWRYSPGRTEHDPSYDPTGSLGGADIAELVRAAQP